MTQLNQIYKCTECGNIVEVVHASGGTLVCCGQPMLLLKENTEDASREKHVPVLEKIGNTVKVQIGSISHPMEEKHHIEWIEVVTENRTYRKFLQPGEAPEAEFEVGGEIVAVREYCNIHGLWKAE